MTSLIERVKDSKTGALVSQIQSLNQTIQSGYFSSKEENLKLISENFELKQKLLKIENSHKAEISRLTKKPFSGKIKFINDLANNSHNIKN